MDDSGCLWDSLPSPVPAAAADPGLRARLCAAYGASDDDQSLVRLGLAAHAGGPGGVLMLSNAGALFMAPREAQRAGVAPRAGVDVIRRCGENWDLRKEFTGTPAEQSAESSAWLCEQIGYDMAFIGLRRIEPPRVPLPAIREIMSNALTHRDYRLPGCQIMVEVFPWPEPRIVVCSPGGFASQPGPDPSRGAPRRLRHPVVASAMQALGAAAGDGHGLVRASESMSGNLNKQPPQFRLEPQSVTVSLDGDCAASPVNRAWAQHLDQTRSGRLGRDDKLALAQAADGRWVTSSAAARPGLAGLMEEVRLGPGLPAVARLGDTLDHDHPAARYPLTIAEAAKFSGNETSTADALMAGVASACPPPPSSGRPAADKLGDMALTAHTLAVAAVLSGSGSGWFALPLAEIARPSGLSVSRVVRAADALAAAGLVDRRLAPQGKERSQWRITAPAPEDHRG